MLSNVTKFKCVLLKVGTARGHQLFAALIYFPQHSLTFRHHQTPAGGHQPYTTRERKFGAQNTTFLKKSLINPLRGSTWNSSALHSQRGFAASRLRRESWDRGTVFPIILFFQLLFFLNHGTVMDYVFSSGGPNHGECTIITKK